MIEFSLCLQLMQQETMFQTKICMTGILKGLRSHRVETLCELKGGILLNLDYHQ